jgi:hypothetical protein
MRNNLAMKMSRDEENSTTNEGDVATRTLGLGLGRCAKTEIEDGREDCKDWTKVAQVVVGAAHRRLSGRRRWSKHRREDGGASGGGRRRELGRGARAGAV